MRPKFIAMVYYEGRIICVEEHGDVYELELPRNGDLPRWRILAHSPWPQTNPKVE